MFQNNIRNIVGLNPVTVNRNYDYFNASDFFI